MKKKYYAVSKGNKPGIYDGWYGENGAEVQIKGFPGAMFMGFSTLDEAQRWFKQVNGDEPALHFKTAEKQKRSRRPKTQRNDTTSLHDSNQVHLYTDGACIKNPGRGGYGVVLIYEGHRKELSGGFRLTTNNRMELFACIVGLRQLRFSCSVIVFSDSRYVVNGIQKGWAKRWRKNGWMRNEFEPAENIDLWAELLDLLSKHNVRFIWVKGHADNIENERCDVLATKAAALRDLPPDVPYEKGETRVPIP